MKGKKTDDIFPFSVFDMRKAVWQRRKQYWLSLGFTGKETREEAVCIDFGNNNYRNGSGKEYVSSFDPVLAEKMYEWFCPKGGTVLDPFAGGVTKGVVASMMGRIFTGIEVRKEQVEANDRFFDEHPDIPKATYLHGASQDILPTLDSQYDFILSCPPYADLEHYSDLEKDLSNMSYKKFIEEYRGIIASACSHLRYGGYAVFVVGEVRDKKGCYLGFVPDTVRAFTDIGMKYINEAVMIQRYGSASLRMGKYIERKRLCKVHQNVLVFHKDDTEYERMKRKLKKYADRTNKSYEELWEQFESM